jgi:DNA (cytosine-5)-methyltransferase 1
LTAFYNEIDPKKAAWLRELIKCDVIAPGVVDERSILDIRPDELRGYRQCHFFAGIAAWSYALRLAGWGDDTEVWTGSCPCQPFSAAGKRKGKEDERHLWPAWFRLIAECRPRAIFAEQVASSDGLAWIDDVYSDLEGAGYAVGAFDLCSAGFGSPNIRQRLFIVAHAEYAERRAEYGENGIAHGRNGLGRRGATGDGLGNAGNAGLQGQRRSVAEHDPQGRAGSRRYVGTPGVDGGPTNGFWRNAEWVWCRDGKYRPTEPGTFPLVARTPARILRLRGYGDCINAQVAAAFIEAAMSSIDG